ncbi:DUF4132 domain-containing protein [Nocardia sp. NPDC057668]|uniref:DUF4132 domain-containing protein n=1 Tax=Nocardia sp. NPDC057668 TaxID=3346202 RepID=UPI00366F5FEF
MATSQVEADISAVPELLAAPPWVGGKRIRPTVVDVVAVEMPAGLEWIPGERELWAGLAAKYDHADDTTWRRVIDDELGSPGFTLVELLADAPEHLARPHLRHLDAVPGDQRYGSGGYYSHFYSNGTYFQRTGTDLHRKLLARFGSDVLAWVIESTTFQTWTWATSWAPITGTGVAARMVETFDTYEAHYARTWFLRHPDSTARALIPAAVGKGVKARRQAETILWLLDGQGHRDLVLAAAAPYGTAVVEVIASTLDRDPLQRLPTRIPKAPAWLNVGGLPRIRLRDRAELLPAPAVEHLISMLMMCAPDDDYAGVRMVAEALDPATLGDFAWALYRAWVVAKYPAKRNMWPLRALGLIGNDETAVRLRTIAQGDRAINRADAALDTLVLMGTRNAHMHIQLVAENSSWPQVSGRAATRIRGLATELGLTVDEFADRLVPDLGLDRQGTFTVDYGTRRFTVGLDDELDPVVREADGSQRSSLPKPGKTDGPAAPAAYAAFGAFKKALKAAVADQSTRLETAMVLGRRWTVANQRTLFIDHPLLRQLARRLVWTTFDAEGAPGTAFRIDADGTLADIEDNPIELADDLSVGLAHPLHLYESIKDWAEVFADYSLVQPFPQIERPSFAPDSPGFAAGLDPYYGAVVPTGKLLGLNRFGWAKGYGENGSTTRFIRTLPGGATQVFLYISPGIDGRNPMGVAEQTIDSLRLPENLDLTDLNLVIASELLRELDTLR